jgi:hypothetical protein
MKKIFFALLISMFLFSLVTAEIQSLPPVKRGDCAEIAQTCVACTAVIVDAVKIQGQQKQYLNAPMQQVGYGYNYSFCNTTILGEYIVTTCGDVAGDGINVCVDYNFDVTNNGKENPTTGLIILFIILFLVLIGTICYVSLYSIGHLMRLDFDMIDMAVDWGLFFMLGALLYFENFYLGNQFVEDYLTLFISVGGILLVLIPLIAFIVSMFVGTMNKKKVQNVPPQRLWRNR